MRLHPGVARTTRGASDLGLLVLAFAILSGCQGGDSSSSGLTLYCAAGVMAPLEVIRAEYEREYGISIQIQYGGSGTLLSSLKISGTGDLFLAADESYIHRGQEGGLVAESLPVALLRPVIAVRSGNPRRVTSLDDLLRDDVKVALANPETAAVGNMTRRIMGEAGLWDALEQHARVSKPTVSDVASDIRIGSVDAGIIWDAVANLYEQLEIVRDPRLSEHAMTITMGVLRETRNAPAALHFARYVAAADRGLLRFADLEYEVGAGDPWEDKPEMLLFCGAMLRPGLEEAIRRFQAREGVVIDTVYEGCGILVSQMKAGASPEAYLSCDLSFLEMVRDRFTDPILLTENDLVILVKKGNPHRVASLADLTKTGLKLGLAHPENSALGHLTRRMLAAEGLGDAMAANQKVESPTGDFLVNQLRAGSLDAVIVYRSNAMATPANLESHLDLIEISHPAALAVQPFAVARDARHPRLLERFLATVISDASRARFESVGFRWRAR